MPRSITVSAVAHIRSGGVPTSVPPPRLQTLRMACRRVLEAAPVHAIHEQLHPQLSPSAWHVGHTHFVEALWLRSRLLEDGADLLPLEALYLPEQCPKAERGGRLPDLRALSQWCDAMSEQADAAWIQAAGRWSHHGMISSGYLLGFVTQHYAQHLEILRMVQQVAAAAAATDLGSHTALQAEAPSECWQHLPGRHIEVGDLPNSPAPYDNELGHHRVELPGFDIARMPVSNGQWLAFMLAGGYERAELWSQAGWVWRQQLGTAAPFHWRKRPDGWFAVLPQGGLQSLRSDEPVYGICHHEASAFACWRRARLPHELEWLTARRERQLDAAGKVWEWCANALYPYPGFRAFPYPGYTLPWCDGGHYVLKGGSRWTEPEIRRDSFRNFYTADMRHIFAGLRLAR